MSEVQIWVGKTFILKITADFQIEIIEVHALLSDRTPLAHQFYTGHISRLNAMNFDIAAGVIIIYCMLSFKIVCEGEEVKEDR